MEGMDPKTKNAILRRLAAGYKQRSLCRHYRISAKQLKEIREWGRRLNNGERQISHEEEKAVAYTPTPEEIEAACEKIRKGWSKRDRMLRTVMEVEELTVPEVFTATPSGASNHGRAIV